MHCLLNFSSSRFCLNFSHFIPVLFLCIACGYLPLDPTPPGPPVKDETSEQEKARIKGLNLKGRIALSTYSVKDSLWSLWILQLESGEKKLIRSSRTPSFDRLRWSWDGKKLVCDDSKQITIIDVEGGVDKDSVIANSAIWFHNAAWSPDGRLAYYYYMPAKNSYWIWIDGSPLLLASTAGGDMSWHPDAKHLFVALPESTTLNVFKLNTQSMTRENLTAGQWVGSYNISPGWFASPAISPNGQKLMLLRFYEHVEGTFYDLWSMNPDGSDRRWRQIFYFSRPLFGWSPDGTKYFLRTSRGWEIFTFSDDKSGTFLIEARSIAWTQ